MNKLSLSLQEKALKEMAERKPYTKKLVGFEYLVLPRVFKGSTDTEVLCENMPIKKGDDVWDIGTGTGLIAFAAKKKGARYVLATDLNPDAVKNTKKNSGLLKLKVDVKLADVFGNINKKFDLITFNPPFTDGRPKQRHHISFWDPGHKTTKKFFEGLHEHLKSGGTACIVWSSFGDTRKLKEIARESGYGLKQIEKKIGKRGFAYYAFQITD